MDLPLAFRKQMQYWLGSEWGLLEESLESPAWRAVRLHRVGQQQDAEVVGHRTPVYALGHPLLPVPTAVGPSLRDPVPWFQDAFYIDDNSQLGKTVYHEAGAFYIQEPSAMAAVAALQPQPGERVLDLCAAPGGKTTGIGRLMKGAGTLVANEIHRARVLTLAQNLERTGVPAVVLNESPQRLSTVFPGWFDAVLVDAPCSGEGMFRKDPGAATTWTEDAPELCAERQRAILTEAIRMTKPGGRIVYSTCTFNPVENEQVIAYIQSQFPVQLLPLPNWPGWQPGRGDWAPAGRDLQHTRRLWPHIGRGEGHFVALLQVTDGAAGNNPASLHATDFEVPAGWHDFLTGLMQSPVPESFGHPVPSGNLLFAAPDLPSTVDKLKVLRPGVCLASVQNGRFEPHHSLAMAVHGGSFHHTLEVSPEEAVLFFGGHAVEPAQTRGWQWIHLDGLPLGWGKSVPGRTNNLYPKGLRRAGLLVSPGQ